MRFASWHRPPSIWTTRPWSWSCRPWTGTQIGGGLQSCPNRIKAAAFSGLPGFHNYDLVASQANGLLTLVDEHNERQEDGKTIDAMWLRQYVADKQAKELIAAKVGIRTDVWKACFYMTIMGGAVSANPHYDMGNLLGKELAADELEVVFPRLQQALQPVRVIVNALAQAYQDLIRNGYGSIGRGFLVWNNHRGVYVRNAAQMSIQARLRDGRKPWTKKHRPFAMANLMAHLLQGLEAEFIAHVTLLSRDYGVKILSNQHDGLITLGEIPEEAIARARTASVLRNGLLVEKPLISK